MLIRISAYVPEPTLSTTAIILAPEPNANRVVEEEAEKAMYRIGFSFPSTMACRSGMDKESGDGDETAREPIWN